MSLIVSYHVSVKAKDQSRQRVHTTSCLMPFIISTSFSGSGVPISLNTGWVDDVDETSSG